MSQSTRDPHHARQRHFAHYHYCGGVRLQPASHQMLRPDKTNSWSSAVIIISMFCCFVTVGSCIKINRFQVPEAVERGKSAVLYCDYSLANTEELYSIKFYKNNVEFYRYVPGESPPKQSYKLNGIHVNLTASNSTHAILTKTSLSSDGLYICEISTEGPIFSTVRSERLMKIYVLPDQSIQIDGGLDQYNYGDNISLVCKCGRSWPQVQLQWLINDVLVESRYTTHLNAQRSSSGLVTSFIALNIYAKPSYFRNGVLQIKCVATLTLVYEYDVVEHLVTGSFKNKSIGRVPSWRKEWSLQPNVKTPIISGMKKNYLLNDILKLNCSTSIRNAKLKWFIMNKEANDSHLIRYDRYNSKSAHVLGLWIKMEKRLIQMPELRLRCLSYYPKQITQFYSKLQIRTFDNQSWESQSSAIGSGVRCKWAYADILITMMILRVISFI